jgi:prepilin-type N-terminal cleavage/methylation domain-containing protein
MKLATKRRPAAGFTLIELLISLAVMVIVLIGVLALFDLNTKLARAQTNLAEMQQSIRVAQYSMLRNARMAGRGGLAVGTLPRGIAVAMCDDVPADPVCDTTDIAKGYEDSPQVVEGTDVLIVRGAFSNPIWQINHQDPTTFTIDSGSEIKGTLRIPAVSHTGVGQSTQALVDAVNDGDEGIPEALLLISPLGEQVYAVVEVDPDSEDTDVSDPDNITVGWKYTDGENTAAYQALTGSIGIFPDALQRVAFVSVLEEYRYYVRSENAVPDDAGTELRPRLAVIRMYPGSEVPYAFDVEGSNSDIADNILDLQVAMGVDVDADGTVVDTAAADDEWLFNHEDDDRDAAGWNVAGRRLSYLRINTLARTERRDWQYVAAPIDAIENHDYGEGVAPADEPERRDRMFRRRLLQSVIDLRNLE